MKFKTWIKSLGKFLDPQREEKYLNTLRIRLADKEYYYSSKLIKATSDLPKYVYNRLSRHLTLFLGGKTFLTDAYEIMQKIKRVDDEWNYIIEVIDKIRYNIDVIFPSKREKIDYNYTPFIEYKNCFGEKGIAFLSYVSNRGNGEIDINVQGEFFDDNGNSIDISNFDKTYLVTPMKDDKTYDRFMYHYTKKLKDAPLSAQTASYKMLNDMWCKQLTYLKLNEE